MMKKKPRGNINVQITAVYEKINFVVIRKRIITKI